jgi:hypothetical protein
LAYYYSKWKRLSSGLLPLAIKRSEKTNYIPKQLLGVIEEAEAKKLPVLEILKLLGIGQDLSPSNINPSNLLGDTTLTPSKSKQIKVEQDLSPSNISPSNLLGDTP